MREGDRGTKETKERKWGVRDECTKETNFHRDYNNRTQ
jgi:hypothetical protein